MVSRACELIPTPLVCSKLFGPLLRVRRLDFKLEAIDEVPSRLERAAGWRAIGRELAEQCQEDPPRVVYVVAIGRPYARSLLAGARVVRCPRWMLNEPLVVPVIPRANSDRAKGAAARLFREEEGLEIPHDSATGLVEMARAARIKQLPLDGRAILVMRGTAARDLHSDGALEAGRDNGGGQGWAGATTGDFGTR